MKNKRHKIPSYLFLLLFLCSLTQIYAVRESVKIYFFNIFPSIITLVVVALYFISVYLNRLKKKRIFATVLAGCYFLSFHTIYSLYIEDNYLLAFLWTKEFLIVFILFASYYLLTKKFKNDKDFNFLKVLRLSLFVLVFFCFLSIIIDKVVDLRWGVYLYLIAFVFVMIDSFFADNKKIQKEENEIPLQKR